MEGIDGWERRIGRWRRKGTEEEKGKKRESISKYISNIIYNI